MSILPSAPIQTNTSRPKRSPQPQATPAAVPDDSADAARPAHPVVDSDSYGQVLNRTAAGFALTKEEAVKRLSGLIEEDSSPENPWLYDKPWTPTLIHVAGVEPKAPVRTFVMARDGYGQDVLIGPGLTAEEVIAFYEKELNGSDGSGDAHDLAVFEGERVAAVLHAEAGATSFVHVTRFLAPTELDRILMLVRTLGYERAFDRLACIPRTPAPTITRSREIDSDGADILNHPVKPGREQAPMVTFRVTNSFGKLESLHEGRGLTLDDVVAWETQFFAPSEGEEGKTSDPYDMTVYHNHAVIAVIRNLGDGQGGYRVITMDELAVEPARPASREPLDDPPYPGFVLSMDRLSDSEESDRAIKITLEYVDDEAEAIKTWLDENTSSISEPDEGDDDSPPYSETLARGNFRNAVERYQAASERLEEVERTDWEVGKDLDKDGDEWKRLANLVEAAERAAGSASKHVCEAVQLLAPDETLGRLYRLAQDWPVRAASYRGKVYISSIGDLEDMGDPLLLVLDEADLVAVD